MNAVISEDQSIFTLINTFDVDADKSTAIVESLREFTGRVTCDLAGFVSASVHVSLDRTRVVNLCNSAVNKISRPCFGFQKPSRTCARSVHSQSKSRRCYTASRMWEYGRLGRPAKCSGKTAHIAFPKAAFGELLLMAGVRR